MYFVPCVAAVSVFSITLLNKKPRHSFSGERALIRAKFSDSQCDISSYIQTAVVVSGINLKEGYLFFLLPIFWGSQDASEEQTVFHYLHESVRCQIFSLTLKRAFPVNEIGDSYWWRAYTSLLFLCSLHTSILIQFRLGTVRVCLNKHFTLASEFYLPVMWLLPGSKILLNDILDLRL